jgi:hypothetical protein
MGSVNKKSLDIEFIALNTPEKLRAVRFGALSAFARLARTLAGRPCVRESSAAYQEVRERTKDWLTGGNNFCGNS